MELGQQDVRPSPAEPEEQPTMTEARKTTARKTTAKTTAKAQSSKAATPSLSAEERAAIKERAAELKAAGRRGSKADGTSDVLAKIAELSPAERRIAERLHAIITAAAPDLKPKTWYGMPGYAKDGKVMCFFQSAEKFSTRYATLGFNDNATLDDGTMWPTAYALAELGDAEEAMITELIKRAAG